MDITHATPELFAAMAAAQGEIENASKNAINEGFKNRKDASRPTYADLAEVLTTIRNTLPKHGLAILQSTGFDGALVNVSTVIAHATGGYITSIASCAPAKTDAQGIGAATTYLRRYSAASMAGIAQEDDDGTASAHDRKPEPVQQIGRPTDGVWEAESEESQAFLLKVAAGIAERMAEPADAFDYVESQRLGVDEKAALWTRLDSKTRSALKRAHVAKQKAA